ncbi:MAG: hypothetical protein ACTSW1_06220 [Candidatus Hodarchaeales archaeon]
MTNENTDKIYSKLTSKEISVLKISLTNIKELYQEEENRKNTAESKATTLLGFAGLITSFIVGYGDFLFSNRDTLDFIPLLVLGITYALTIIFIIISIIFSIKSLSIGVYHKNKHADNIFTFQDLNEVDIIKNWIATTIYSINNNLDTINKKVDYVKDSQTYFSKGIICLAINAMFFVLILFMKSYQANYSEALVFVKNLILGFLVGLIIYVQIEIIKKKKKIHKEKNDNNND